ncbi:FAD-dependent monooxygenase [Amycolatopsis sp. NPDC003861]
MSLSPELPRSTDVLVVGAGPVGLTMGCALRTLGIDHVVIDRAPGPAAHSRASAVHVRTLESLAAIGVADELVARSIPGRTFTVRDAEKVLLSIPFAELDTPYPYALSIPQMTTEEVLAERYAALGGTVHRTTSLLDLRDTFPGSTASIVDSDGVVRAIDARYVVGADGIHSTVRDRIGVAFPGGARPQTFMLAEVTMDWHGPEDEVVTFYFSPRGLGAVAKIPGDLYRVVALVGDDAGVPTREDVQEVIDTRGPGAAGGRVREVKMASNWRVHERLADTFRQGPVFLVGDAGHVHSPVGGQGLNTGVQDALNLAWKLGAVLDGTAAPALLDTYDAERRPVAAGVLGFTGTLTEISTQTNPASIGLRNEVLDSVAQLPAFRAWLATRLAGLHIGYGGAEGPHSPGPGRRVAPRRGMAPGIGWTLVIPPAADAVAVKEAAEASVTPITVLPDGDATHATLVRPDGYVALTADAEAAATLPAGLAAWLRRS